MTAPDAPAEPLTAAGRSWLESRIRQLRSRQGSVGPFRAAGIQRTIASMKRQVREGVWTPHGIDGTAQPQPTDQNEGEKP